MKKILVTGGCGYIGVHTIVDLIQNGYEVVSIDNNSRSNSTILEGAEKILGQKIKNYVVDLCNLKDTENIFEETKSRRQFLILQIAADACVLIRNIR